MEVLNSYTLDPPIELFTLPEQGNSTQNCGVRTGSGEYILRTHHDGAEAVRYEHHLLQWLADKKLSFAIPNPILRMDGTTWLQTPQGLHSLAMRLPGARLDRHDARHMEKMGSALGELHATLAQYPSFARPGARRMAELEYAHPLLPDPYNLTPQHLHLVPTPANDELLGWWRDELTLLQSSAKEFHLQLPRQVIHHDFIPNNVLIDAGQVSAVLDFEFATFDVRVLDIAIALRNMLRVWEDTEPWLVVDPFCTGCHRWIKLDEGEIDAIPPLMRLRNVWLALKRLGRALAAGDVRAGWQQLEYAQRFAQWLETHQHRLLDQLKAASI